MLLLVTQLLGKTSRISHRPLRVVLSHLQLVGLVLDVRLTTSQQPHRQLPAAADPYKKSSRYTVCPVKELPPVYIVITPANDVRF